MAAGKNLTVVLGADTSGLQSAIKNAKTTLEAYAKQAKKASTSIKESSQATNEQVASYKRSVKALEKITSGSLNAEKASKALAKEVQKLKDQWNSLGDSAKKSNFGKSISESYSSATAKLKEVRSEMGKMAQGMKISKSSVVSLTSNMADFSAGLLKAMGGAQSTGGAISALTSLTNALGVSSTGASAGLSSMAGAGSLAASGAMTAAGAYGVAIGAAIKLGETMLNLWDQSRKFDKDMHQFKVGGLDDEAVEHLKEQVRSIASEFRMTKEEVIKVISTVGTLAPQLKKNGEALEFVSRNAIQLANAALIPVDNAARALITVLTQMNVSVAMSKDVIDVLAQAAHDGTADIDYLQKAIGTCGKSAASAGISYQELVATLETIAPHFSSAEEAGQKLHSVFKSLIDQGNKKFNPSIVGWEQALENLASANLSTAKMAELVGDSNVYMLKSLIEGKSSISDYARSFENVKDSMATVKENMEVAKSAFDMLRDAWEKLKSTLISTEMVQGFGKMITTMINKVTVFVQKLDSLAKKAKAVFALFKDTRKITKDIDEANKKAGEANTAKSGRGRTWRGSSEKVDTKETSDSVGKEVKTKTKTAIKEGLEEGAKVSQADEKVAEDIKKKVKEATKSGLEEGAKSAKKTTTSTSTSAPNLGPKPSESVSSSGSKVKFSPLGGDEYLKRVQEQARKRKQAEKIIEDSMKPENPNSVPSGAAHVKEAAKATADASKKGAEYAEKIEKAMQGAADAAKRATGQGQSRVADAEHISGPSFSTGGSSRKRKKKAKATTTASGRGPAESTSGVDVNISQTGGDLAGIGAAAEEATPKISKMAGAMKSLKGVAKAAGWVGATITAVDLLKEGAANTMDFNKAQSTLQAVLGVSASEMAALTAQAQELGSTTKYSASEIASLQIELAKLGFGQEEILGMTKNVQNLGTALDSDLGSSAALTGATMRMFGLQAKDSQRIVDVFAASCSKSALSFSYLDSAMSTVGPVANAFGLTLEDTIGLLGTLSNAGFDASSAATAARNIILNLADSNGDLAKTLGRTVKSGKDMLVALRDLKAGGIDLATALELTDKRSVAAFNTMMDSAETGYALMDALYAADGAAQKMSDTMADNLTGDVAGMKSAWEALMLELMGGQDILRLLVQEITDLIRIIIDIIKDLKAFCQEVEIVGYTLKGLLTAWVWVWNAAVAIIKTAIKLCVGILEGLYYALTFRFGKAKDAVVKNAKDIGQAWVDMANKSIEQTNKIWGQTVEPEVKVKPSVEVPKMPDVKPISAKPVKGKKDGKTGKTTKEEKIYDEGSIGKLEQRISKLQEALKAAPTSALRTSIQREIDALSKQKEAIELELRPVLPEGSLALINRQIQDQQNLLDLAIDDKSRKKIQDEIDKLTGQKEAIELKLKPIVEEKDIQSIAEQIAEHRYEVHAEVIAEQTSGEKKSEPEKAQSNADKLKGELDFHKQIMKAHQDEYKEIQKKIAAGGILNSNEQELANVYEEATRQVNKLTQAYEKAQKAATLLQAKSNYKKAIYNGVKGSIDTLGGLNDSISSVGSTWTNLTKNWEDMTPFEQITNGISAVIGTIQEAIGIYESIADMIDLFGDIAAASSAKKIAADEAEMAMDTTKTTTESANLATKLANDASENASEIGKLGVKEAGSIASATSSGASLPFPANIAAIAAGIAAVVAAFSMVFSCFADGGIVSGATHNGDYNLARVNSGEMILNGTQQKKLFNLLNGSGGVTSSTLGNGVVDFKIRGKNLVGTLKNTNKRYSKI